MILLQLRVPRQSRSPESSSKRSKIQPLSWHCLFVIPKITPDFRSIFLAQVIESPINRSSDTSASSLALPTEKYGGSFLMPPSATLFLSPSPLSSSLSVVKDSKRILKLSRILSAYLAARRGRTRKDRALCRCGTIKDRK